jgi:hypothetical protein
MAISGISLTAIPHVAIARKRALRLRRNLCGICATRPGKVHFIQGRTQPPPNFMGGNNRVPA